jgi:hypothetical protein
VPPFFSLLLWSGLFTGKGIAIDAAFNLPEIDNSNTKVSLSTFGGCSVEIRGFPEYEQHTWSSDVFLDANVCERTTSQRYVIFRADSPHSASPIVTSLCIVHKAPRNITATNTDNCSFRWRVSGIGPYGEKIAVSRSILEREPIAIARKNNFIENEIGARLKSNGLISPMENARRDNGGEEKKQSRYEQSEGIPGKPPGISNNFIWMFPKALFRQFGFVGGALMFGGRLLLPGLLCCLSSFVFIFESHGNGFNPFMYISGVLMFIGAKGAEVRQA